MGLELLFFADLQPFGWNWHVNGYFAPCRLNARAAFFGRVAFLPNEPPTHQNMMLNPIMTKAAGHPKMVAITGCHKKGEQSNAVISPHGSI